MLIPKVVARGRRLRRSRDDFTSNYNGKVGASQLSRVNLAPGLPRPARIDGRESELSGDVKMRRRKWRMSEGERGEREGGGGGGYKIDDVSASVIRNTFIPFVSLHWRLTVYKVFP